jgi:hypothetical protein
MHRIAWVDLRNRDPRRQNGHGQNHRRHYSKPDMLSHWMRISVHVVGTLEDKCEFAPLSPEKRAKSRRSLPFF